MKKLLLLIIGLVFVCKVGRTQTNVYQPFPQDSAVWLYIFSTPSGETWTYTKWLGTTVINSKTYTQVYQSAGNAIGQYANTVNWNYTGGIRQDIPNEKIYQIDGNGIEHDISVSQHLVVGDTMPQTGSSPMLITSIDSALVYGIYHKVYHSQNAFSSEAYIVGVGVSSSSTPAGYNNLACFTINNINQPGSSTPPFCKLTSINQFKNNQSNIFIYPNPAQNNFTIETTSTDKQTLQVFDVTGKLVLSQLINGTTTINTSHLSEGIYNLSIISNRAVLNKRLVIVK
jgi:hypothetical protein